MVSFCAMKIAFWSFQAILPKVCSVEFIFTKVFGWKILYLNIIGLLHEAFQFLEAGIFQEKLYQLVTRPS